MRRLLAEPSIGQQVPLHLGPLDPGGQAPHRAGQHAEAGCARGLLRALVEQLDTHADPEERQVPPPRRRPRHGREAARRSASAHRAEGADAGQHDAVGLGGVGPGSATSRASAPRCWRAFSAERRLPMP